MTNYLSEDLNEIAVQISIWRANKGFDTNWSNCPEKLMLVVTELGEAMEAYRKLSQKTLNYCGYHGGSHLPAQELPEEQYRILTNFREEIADTFIRLLDMVGSFGIDIAQEIDRKMHINEGRPYKHGKEC